MDSKIFLRYQNVLSEVIKQIELVSCLADPVQPTDPFKYLKQEYQNLINVQDVKSALKLLKIAISSQNKFHYDMTKFTPEERSLTQALKKLGMITDKSSSPNIGDSFEKIQSARAKSNLQAVEKEIEEYEDKVRQLKETHEKERQEKEKQIAELNLDLKDIQISTTEIIAKLGTKKAQKDGVIKSKHADIMSTLQVEYDSLTKELYELQKSFKDEELAMRRRREKKEAELDTLVNKYETYMGEKQAEVDVWKALYGGDQSKFDQLSDKYAKLNDEWQKLQDEKAKEEQREREREERVRKETTSAVKIQALWRGYKTRLDLKGDGKNKKVTKSKKNGKK